MKEPVRTHAKRPKLEAQFFTGDRILNLHGGVTLSGSSSQVLTGLLEHRRRQAAATGAATKHAYPVFWGHSVSLLPHFKEAECSAIRSIENLLKPKRPRHPVNEWRQALQWVFDMYDGGMDTVECVLRLRALLGDAVYDGNFFNELRKGFPIKRQQAERRVTPLAFYLIAFWTERLLWLATDFAVTLYFKHTLRLTRLTEAALTKERQRLKLCQYPGRRKPIFGFSHTQGFIFRDGYPDKFLPRTLSS